MSTKAEMEAVAEALYHEGWNAAIKASIDIVTNNASPMAMLNKLRELLK